MPAPDLTILILAAGASSRMRGADKLLEPVGGQPLLRHVVQSALATSCPVVCALPPDRPARGVAVRGLAVETVTVPDPGEGMAASLRAGMAAIVPCHSVMLLLADLPNLTPADLTAMVQAHILAPDVILRATSADGQPGHPVIFPAGFRADLLRLRGDEGARQVLRDHAAQVRLIALPGQHAITDLDTPEAWAEWRSGRQ